jgi:hypothetical protein
LAIQGSNSDSKDCLRFVLLLPMYRIFILACTLKTPGFSGVAEVILAWLKSNHSDQISSSVLVSGSLFSVSLKFQVYLHVLLCIFPQQTTAAYTLSGHVCLYCYFFSFILYSLLLISFSMDKKIRFI